MMAKTIVFITHDFDEALRLADRIAIMKDGAVEQCDTPERIVMAPATDYVAKFTSAVDRSRVVRAGALAHPVSDAAVEGEAVASNETLHALARMLLCDPRARIPVSGPDGALMGLMDREAAVEILLGPDAPRPVA
jgi:glycine betaine/proline transport system ATP-binding protein